MRIVVDASAVVELLFRTDREEALERLILLPQNFVHAPALCDVEVAAAVRRALSRRLLSVARAAEVIEDYVDLPISRHGHEALLVRTLDLRENISVYDATYVALAESLGATLVTSDRSLVRAVQTHTKVETILV